MSKFDDKYKRINRIANMIKNTPGLRLADMCRIMPDLARSTVYRTLISAVLLHPIWEENGRYYYADFKEKRTNSD